MNQIIFQYLNNLAGKFEWLDIAVIFSAEYLGYWLIVGLLAFLALGKNKKREIKMLIYAVLSVILSRAIITELIRFFYYSPRPFVNNEVYQLITHDPTGSFPSGHAAFFFALAMAVYLFLPQIRFRPVWIGLFFTGAAIIGISRVIAGIHWPADILAGAIVGILSALIIRILSTYLGKYLYKFS